MGMVTIFVMWPRPFKQTCVSLSKGGAIWNLTLIGQAVSEEKMFKECGRLTMVASPRAYLSYKLISKPSAQVS